MKLLREIPFKVYLIILFTRLGNLPIWPEDGAPESSFLAKARPASSSLFTWRRASTYVAIITLVLSLLSTELTGMLSSELSPKRRHPCVRLGSFRSCFFFP